MKNKIAIIFLIVITLSFLGFYSYNNSYFIKNIDKPKISFTFDDGSVANMPNYKLEQWNQMILDNLKKYNLKAVLFATGSRLTGSRGNYVLSSWNNNGHKIGNHTYTHPNYNNEKITLKKFESELIKNDSIINNYSNYYPYFRFPYLKEGNTIPKRDKFREFLQEKKYKIGSVTIDASDWFINSRLIKHLKENKNIDVSGYQKYYIDHLYDRALYYDSLAYKLIGRKINHVLLLHHNLSTALFLDKLIEYFLDNGWEVMDADKAYTDEIYEVKPDNIPAGESLIWALAKQSGKFENELRYPAEDSRYEKDKMDKLGL